ncbi:MAG: Rne/Rng family ribonuclease [Bacillota bacterium]
MVKEILAEVGLQETRVAVVEDNELAEIYFERENEEQIVGSIYKGIVTDVLPGMQAAFVNVGLDKNVFLHVSDALALMPEEKRSKDLSIQDVVQPGQKIMVQITKGPVGDKGARASCDLNLPGRYLVLMTSMSHIGISRRIEDQQKRDRLKKIAQDIRPDEMGVIVRTAAANKSRTALEQDLQFLVNLWQKTLHNYRQQEAPAVLHSDLDLVSKIVRDKLTTEVDRVLIDDQAEYQEIKELVDFISPHLKSRIKLYDQSKPLFEYYHLESEVEKLIKRRVWLNCGGYIIFDSTEALTAVDVNTGKFVGSKNLADTVLKTNLEAAVEIAKQLKLRNIGGIIIIDFIDMKNKQHQSQVVSALEEELAKDKTKTAILGLTELGLVEMTRKKEKEGVAEFLQKSCPYCQGSGRVLSEDTVALKTIRKLKKLFNNNDQEAVLVEVHPQVAARLIGLGGNNLEELESELGRHIYVKGAQDLHIEEIDVVALGTQDEIVKLALPVAEGDELTLEIEETHVTNKQHGIARVEGFIIDIIDASHLVGEEVKVKIKKVYRTYAKAEVIDTL